MGALAITLDSHTKTTNLIYNHHATSTTASSHVAASSRLPATLESKHILLLDIPLPFEPQTGVFAFGPGDAVAVVGRGGGMGAARAGTDG